MVRNETVWVFIFIKVFQSNLSGAYLKNLVQFTPLNGVKIHDLNICLTDL